MNSNDLTEEMMDYIRIQKIRNSGDPEILLRDRSLLKQMNLLREKMTEQEREIIDGMKWSR